MPQGACAEEGEQMSLAGGGGGVLTVAKPEVTQNLHTTAHQLPLRAESRQGHPSELAGGSPTSRIVAEGGAPLLNAQEMCKEGIWVSIFSLMWALTF